jgi:hypothetical protein
MVTQQCEVSTGALKCLTLLQPAGGGGEQETGGPWRVRDEMMMVMIPGSGGGRERVERGSRLHDAGAAV